MSKTSLIDLFADIFIYRNARLAIDHSYDPGIAHEEIWLMHENLKINSILLQSSDPSDKVVLYFHGNSDNLERWSKEAVFLTQYGMDVLVVDYPGYGKSEGKANEANLYATGEAVLHWLRSQDYDQYFIYGRSLGSSVALHTASRSKPEAIILETTFYDMKNLIQATVPAIGKLYTSPSFENHKYVSSIESPIYIFQGTKDRVTPIEEAQKLEKLLSAKDAFFIIEGANHRNVQSFDSFKKELRQIFGN